MAKITLDQFCAQWVLNPTVPNTRIMASRLEHNIGDFITRAGEYSKSRFISSFAEGGFYGSGTKWAPRTSKWGKKFTHPVMIDTGELKNQIKGAKGRSGNYGGYHTKDFKRSYSYEITTNEQSVPITGKRGSKRGSNNYAAVHNTDPKLGLYTVNQYSSRRPEQRQFIGLSPKIDNFINTFLVPTIFKGFPNDKK